MAPKKQKILKRDGFSGPPATSTDRSERAPEKLPPAPIVAPSKEAKAPPVGAFSRAYSDPNNRTVGKSEVTPAEFGSLSGAPSPRQKAARGESIGGKAPDANPLAPFSAGD
jgi:hypothetical protein